MQDKYNNHIEAVRKIFLQAIAKGSLSTALRAKMLEIKLEEYSQKSSAIDFTKISEDDLERMINQLQKQIEDESSA